MAWSLSAPGSDVVSHATNVRETSEKSTALDAVLMGPPSQWPLGERVDIQMSRLGAPLGLRRLPGRLDAQTSVRPSCDRLDCCSIPVEFIGVPRFTGGDQGSWMLRRGGGYRSFMPSVPGRGDWEKISLPSARSVAPAACRLGSLGSEKITAGQGG